MCQLFAISADKPVNLRRELKDFFRGSFVHKHGWGYADFGGRRVYIKRETTPAYVSETARKLSQEGGPFQNAFFHLRYATIGAVEYENSHPLSAMDIMGRTWTIIHNGTIFDGTKTDPYFYQQSGGTDTERLLLYLIDEINKKSLAGRVPLTDKERFEVVDRTLQEVAPGNKLNVILSDSEIFYLHGNSRSGSRILGEYGKNDYLYRSLRDGVALFCTVPLDAEGWEPLPLNTVLAYKDGVQLFGGTAGGVEYIETDDDIKYLYLGVSAL
jgi:glutamine amidotransferase